MELMEMHVTGQAVDRRDGALKVTGAATYAAEYRPEAMLYAVAVNARIAHGRARSVDDAAARAVPGVIEVLTPFNAPRLEGRITSPYEEQDNNTGLTALAQPVHVLQDRQVLHYGQEVGVVVATSFEAARHAAMLVRVDYEEASAKLELRDHLDEAFTPEHMMIPIEPDSGRGDVEKAWDEAELKIEAEYETPVEQHATMEPGAAIAEWRDGGVIVHTSTQNVFSVQKAVANTFSLPVEKVRVVCPFIGGGFGCKVGTWAHVHLAVLAAKAVGRPVKLPLSRQQMFFMHGHRPNQLQRWRIAATREGKLAVLDQEILVQTGERRDFVEHTGETTGSTYACPNVRVRHRGVRTNVPGPTIMRAPGSAPGMFALESLMDEMAYKLGLDPIEFRLRNDPEKDPEQDRPWSSKSLRQCWEEGRDRFGWARRTAEPGTMRDGRWRVGYGCATAVYPSMRSKCAARMTLAADGSLLVETAASDIGTGTYTILAQIASDAAGVPLDKVSVRLGDTELPYAPGSGGSWGAMSFGSAVLEAGEALRAEALKLAGDGSPLHGMSNQRVKAAEGRLFAADDPERGETYAELMARAGRDRLSAHAQAEPDDAFMKYGINSFGAGFCEVRIDPDTCEIRVPRFLGVYGIGRVLNPKTARSQLIGGITWGIGMALLEECVLDTRTGHFVNDDLAEYHVPVNADIREVEVHFVDEVEDKLGRLGGKGCGELGIVGAAAAVANAVFHATGVRLRKLPINVGSLAGRI